jgi:uncharacterized glyoxalase superfamily protein PhnB
MSTSNLKQPAIVRIWRGRTPRDRADEYEAYNYEVGIKPLISKALGDALYRRAKAAGAKIVLDIKDEDYGGRGFSCRDLEGHLWNFGTYDPWESHRS